MTSACGNLTEACWNLTGDVFFDITHYRPRTCEVAKHRLLCTSSVLEFSQGVLRAKDRLSPDERYLFNQIIGTRCGVQLFCLSFVGFSYCYTHKAES